MGIRKILTAALAGGMFTLGSSGAMATLCSDVHTISDWSTAGSCTQGDKEWTFNSKSASLSGAAGIAFTFIGDTYAMQITGFDLSTAAGAWSVNYTISVTNPAFFIATMAAGADNPAPSVSTLNKDVTGDDVFSLSVTNGLEVPGVSDITGLTANTLTVDEVFTVGANSTLLSVSDTFTQKKFAAPLPGTLALLGLGLVALGALRRRST